MLPRPRRPARRRGFTLLELVIVVTTMGLLAAVAVPRLTGVVTTRRVTAAAERVAADLRYARAYARATGTPVTVGFDEEIGRYTLVDVPPPVGSGGDYSVELGETPYGCVLELTVVPAASDLTFDAYGLPVSAGTSWRIEVSEGSTVGRVDVDVTSGETTVTTP